MPDDIPEFDDRGLLPEGATGFYYPSLEDFKERFVSVVDMEIRSNLFEKYVKFCIKCLNTDTLICHYVNGSYTTIEEDPEDIDLLVMLDVLKVEDMPDELVDDYLDINNRYIVKEEYSCDSYCALECPVSDPLFDYHNAIKKQVISWWQLNFIDEKRTIEDPIPKGVIILSKEEIKKVRS